MYARDVTAGDHTPWLYIKKHFFTKYHWIEFWKWMDETDGTYKFITIGYCIPIIDDYDLLFKRSFLPTQIPAPSQEKYIYLWKIDISQSELSD